MPSHRHPSRPPIQRQTFPNPEMTHKHIPK
jgi:hypothetical protein